jgi:uncharacterized NAD(P)/FAD-binding protein YdhS
VTAQLDAPTASPAAGRLAARLRPGHPCSSTARKSAGGTGPVVVIGAGAAGALAVLHLRRAGVSDLVVIDPAGELGAGTAYGTTDDGHLLNVKAEGMSALPDDPGHFLRWLRREQPAIGGGDFVPRHRFAEYLADATAAAGAPTRLRTRVTALLPGPLGAEVHTADGRRISARSVVLALGPPPSGRRLPSVGPSIPDPWAPGALAQVLNTGVRHRRVLLVGTGLTMVDVAITLAAADPDLVVHAVSRQGLTPRAHRATPTPVGPAPELPSGPLTLETARALIAGSIAEARAGSDDWRPGVDRLRPVTNALWQALSPVDQQRALRGAREWDVLRHRLAPAVGLELARLREQGRVDVFRAGDLSRPSRYDVTVTCTGFGPRCTSHPLVADLCRRGLARAHPLGVGLRTDSEGHPIRRDGRRWTAVTVLGALRRGQLWETTAIPEIRKQAAEYAAMTSGAVSPG